MNSEIIQNLDPNIHGALLRLMNDELEPEASTGDLQQCFGVSFEPETSEPKPEQAQSHEERLGCRTCESYYFGWCLAAKPGSQYNISFLTACPLETRTFHPARIGKFGTPDPPPGCSDNMLALQVNHDKSSL